MGEKREIEERAKNRGSWTPGELATMADVSDQWVRRLLTNGELRGSKAGPVWIIPYSEGRRWIEDRA